MSLRVFGWGEGPFVKAAEQTHTVQSFQLGFDKLKG